MAPNPLDDVDPWAAIIDGPVETEVDEDVAPDDVAPASPSPITSFLENARRGTQEASDDDVDVTTMRSWRPPRIRHFRSLDDVTKATEKMVKAYVAGEIDAEDVGAFAKLANTLISAAKTKAVTASLGASDEDQPDITEQDARPDIEAVRPVVIEATNFEGMTDEERRELADRIKKQRGYPTNGS